VPAKIDEILSQWTEMLKSSGLPFIPENIFENGAFKAHMEVSREVYLKIE
jgi:hypothetical protein